VVLGDQQLIVMIPQFILKKLEVLMDGGAMTRPTMFACWFQPAQTSQSTVFFSKKKSALASPKQHQHQPANRPIISVSPSGGPGVGSSCS